MERYGEGKQHQRQSSIICPAQNKALQTEASASICSEKDKTSFYNEMDKIKPLYDSYGIIQMELQSRENNKPYGNNSGQIWDWNDTLKRQHIGRTRTYKIMEKPKRRKET